MRENKVLIATWVAVCLVMSTFTFLPVVKVEDITMMYVSVYKLSRLYSNDFPVYPAVC
jgi:Phosphatidylinositolglycan class N (PIG-N)